MFFVLVYTEPPKQRSNFLAGYMLSAIYYLDLIFHDLLQQYSSKSLPPPPVVPHPHLSDVIVVPNYGPRSDILPQKKKVIVDLRCGIAVLRGADVFAPGVIGAPKGTYGLSRGGC